MLSHALTTKNVLKSKVENTVPVVEAHDPDILSGDYRRAEEKDRI